MHEEQEERTLTELGAIEDLALEQEDSSTAEREAPPAAAGEEGDPLAALRTELEAERQARQAADDCALRYRADFENLRRRTMMEAEQTRINLLRGIVEQFLPVLDDMERALASAGTEAPPGWAAGLEMIQRRFLTALSEYGVERMESVGRPFDPARHEAMLRVEDSEQPPETVVEELRPGYTLGDQVIRPALVKVQV